MKKIVYIQSDYSEESNKPSNLSPFLLLDFNDYIRLDAAKDTTLTKNNGSTGGQNLLKVVYSFVSADSATLQDQNWIAGRSALVIHKDNNSSSEKVIELWVNTPEEKSPDNDKFNITYFNVPVAKLNNDIGSARILVGKYNEVYGPVKANAMVNLWDIQLNKGCSISLPDGNTTIVYVLHGKVSFKDGYELKDSELGIFERIGGSVKVNSLEATRLIYISGEPIDEPIIGKAKFDLNAPKALLEMNFHH